MFKRKKTDRNTYLDIPPEELEAAIEASLDYACKVTGQTRESVGEDRINKVREIARQLAKMSKFDLAIKKDEIDFMLNMYGDGSIVFGDPRREDDSK